MNLSPSKIILNAVRAEMQGTRIAEHEHACAICGGTIHPGEIMDDIMLKDTFTNHSSLANPFGHVRCGACVTMMDDDHFRRGLSAGLACEDGFFPIGKKIHRAWALMNPPQNGPFVMMIQNAQSQHVAWRSPISLSPELMMLRIGEAIIRIRHSVLMRARECAIALNQLRDEKENQGKKTKIKAEAKNDFEHPFVNNFDMTHFQGGYLKNWVINLKDECDITPLLHMTSGEVWVLGAVLGDAERPDPVLLHDLHIEDEKKKKLKK